MFDYNQEGSDGEARKFMFAQYGQDYIDLVFCNNSHVLPMHKALFCIEEEVYLKISKGA